MIDFIDFNKLAEYLHKDNKYINVAKELESKGLYKVIVDEISGEPYMVRYYYMDFKPDAKICIHKILKSDVDGLHNHPWQFKNYIFSGGYLEHTVGGKIWRSPGYSATNNHDFFHKLEINPESKEEVWTLFLMGPKKYEWGFINDNGVWEHWRSHLKKRNENRIKNA